MELYTCPVCRKECQNGLQNGCQNGGIYCSSCARWVHATCNDLTDVDFCEWADRSLQFVCVKCAFLQNKQYNAEAALNRWADRQTAVGIDGNERKFDHPFLQAVGMFIGEFSCLVAFFLIKLFCKHRLEPAEGEDPPRSFNPLIFLPAAMCDMCGTSIMYIGLNLTYASSFQMLRGAVIIFTALLSVAFLGRVIKKHMWAGMFTVLVGLILVGLSDIVFNKDASQSSNINGVIAGDLLIIMAQVIVAVQMVYEERFIGRFNVPPLAAVGWEGFFGAVVLGLLLIPFSYITVGNFSNTAGHKLENVEDAFVQMGNNKLIILAIIGNIVSIAFFNFAGISVTKELSATTRMVLDSVRTLVIWVFSLAVKWQKFQYLQIVGFIILVVGMCLYNDIIIMPAYRKWKARGDVTLEQRQNGSVDPGEQTRLLNANSKSEQFRFLPFGKGLRKWKARGDVTLEQRQNGSVDPGERTRLLNDHGSVN